MIRPMSLATAYLDNLNSEQRRAVGQTVIVPNPSQTYLKFWDWPI
jgi:hypothetical protein